MNTNIIKYIWWIIRPAVNNYSLGPQRVYFVKIILTVLLLNVIPICHSHAGTWNETFNDETLKGWERISSVEEWRVRWEVVEGILFSQIRRSGIAAVCKTKDGSFMHWTANQFRLDTITVIGTEIIFPPPGRGGWGDLGLFMGKRQQSPDFVAKGYFFSPVKINQATFGKKDGYIKGKIISEYGDNFQFTTKSIKVAFVSGKFRILTGTTLIAEFNDNTLPEIDVVGVLITCNGEWFNGSISGITISGNGIPNHNLSLAVKLRNTQLTTTWAQLKQHE